MTRPLFMSIKSNINEHPYTTIVVVTWIELLILIALKYYEVI